MRKTSILAGLSLTVLAALCSAVPLAGMATAATGAETETAVTRDYRCKTWTDFAHGRGRGHAYCKGYTVRVRALCKDPRTGREKWFFSKGGDAWGNRYEYHKADCALGWKAIQVRPTAFV